MKSVIMFFMIVGIAILPSCYTSANIRKIDTNVSQHSKKVIYRYRIGGLQQMMVSIFPGRGIIYDRYNDFTQEQLSNLRVSITSLNGKMDVRDQIIQEGETKVIDLRRNIVGRGESDNTKVSDLGTYVAQFRVVSIEPSIHLRKLDFVLIVEDLNGFTRDKGIRVSGGFQDSL